MDDQLKGFLEVVLLGPADDELLGLRIEITLVKGRGVDRIENLLEVLNFNLNELMGRIDGHRLIVSG
jgi:hypothetical protein